MSRGMATDARGGASAPTLHESHPTTRKLWHVVGDATENQVYTCFRSDSDENMPRKVFRAAFVCSMIPLTPPTVAAFALAFTLPFVSADLVDTAITCAEIGAPKPAPTGQPGAGETGQPATGE
jgi:hypothetical protein